MDAYVCSIEIAMSDRNDNTADDRRDERDSSMPALRSWWEGLSLPAKVLIPTTAVVLVFVTGSALPPFVF
jgi:hypothetical protein